MFSGGGAVLDGGRLLALLAFETAQDEFGLGGEAAGGAVAVAAPTGGVEDPASAGDGLLAGDHVAGQAASRVINCPAETP